MTLTSKRSRWRSGPLALVSLALLVAAVVPGTKSYALPSTPTTGNTGLTGSAASVITIPGFQRLEGAMIPRQCQVGTIVQPSSTTDVVAALAKAKAACKAAGGKTTLLFHPAKSAGHRRGMGLWDACHHATMAEGAASTGLLDSLPAVGNVLSPVALWLSVRASRQLYHASSDLLCPEAQALRGKPACSVVLDMERMKEVVRIDAERKTVTVGPTLILDSLMRVLERQGLALDFQRLPFYSNLTLAGMLLTAAHGSSRSQPSTFGGLVSSLTWVDAGGTVHSTSDMTLWVGSNGLLGIITEMTLNVVPLTKLKALARRMHDKKLRSSLSSVLGDKNLVLIQWLPDVMQAIIMTREAVPLSTPGNAVFQVHYKLLLLTLC
ncbi:hypothetical protein QJQ45_027109 [Haematococcus lacustris]|nr:hypothetical protein QJQ45_027109 [Haematococcus lacustris]